MPKTPVSVTIITLNEAGNIAACLDSVSWADDVVVVDSGSTDGTVDVAKARGARVISRDWPGYSAQKNFAASQAKHDWILSLDADERVTPYLAKEIEMHLASQPASAGYRIPRVTWHLDRWIRTTDWYPDFQLRLYHRARASWAPRLVHESVIANGEVRQLHNEIQHYAYRDLAHHFVTMDRYTTLAAQEMYAAGRRASVFDLTIHPLAAFLRNYILKRGFTDGTVGFIISKMNAHYVFLKFAKLRELRRGQRSEGKGQR